MRYAPAAASVTTQQVTIREVEATISASIHRSLYEALREQGEGPQLVQQLVDVFQWDIDFFELRKGDSFSLVVKKQYAGADLIGYGPIHAARFTHRGTTYEAFRHEQPDGRAGYYAAAGTPLRAVPESAAQVHARHFRLHEETLSSRPQVLPSALRHRLRRAGRHAGHDDRGRRGRRGTVQTG
jgi:hypothetical protein